ncbi:MAG: PAS domain S-box protein [Pyrinomonadaceae bacterium]
MKLALERQIQLAFLFAFLLLLTIGFFAYRNANSLNEALKLEKNTQEILLQLDDTFILAIDAEASGRGYVITGNETFLEPYVQSEEKISQNLARLRLLVEGNPNEKAELAKLEALLTEKLNFTKNLIDTRRRQGFEAAIEKVNSGEGKKLMDEVRFSINRIKTEEMSLLRERENDLNENISNTLFILFFGTGAGIVSLTLANFAVFREAGKHLKVKQQLREANKNLEKRVEERTVEISQKNEELKEQIRQREQIENRRRIALESGSLGTWTLDPKTDKAEIDERSLSLFGLSAGDFDGSGQNAFSRIHKEDFPSIEELLQKSIEEKTTFKSEFRVLMPDGKVRWNHCNGQPQFDENGEITHIIGHCRDITENKENELFLRQSEQNVRNIIDSLFAFVGVLTPDGILIEANRPALEAASLKSEDVTGKHFADTYWWSYSEEVQKQLLDAIEKANNGERVRYDVTIRLGENKFIPIDFMLAPLFDENGRVTRLIPSGLDLTPRKEAEDRLRKSENFARAILNSLSAHISVLDKTGRIIAVNEAWQNFAKANCVEEQISATGTGQNYLKVSEKSEAFEENTKKAVENLRAVLSGEKTSFSLEYPCHSPTEERWFLLQANAMQGAEGGAVVSHINITDRKKAEVKLRDSEEFNRSIFENSPDCIHVLELDGTVHSINNHGLELMEIDEVENYIGKRWVDFWEDEEAEVAYQAVQTAAKGSNANLEGFSKTAQGTLRYWHSSVAPVFDSEGKPSRLISTSRDITERKKAEREREELLKREQAARKDAEIANRLRDEFLATVSHELRAPLNSILGWGRLLEKGNLDERTTGKAVNTIVRNAEAQNRLIEDLLDVSRIISGKLRLEVMTIKPINVVESALETVRPAAEAKGIRLEIKENPDVSHISGDPNRLQQVIWNLLSNAIKFTPNEGRVALEIERNENFVEIRVKDSGVGIKEEFLPHVFDRFTQADASSIRKFGGLGLGLAIVRHITEMHGGTVHAFSAGENKGSTFVVRLPLVTSPKEEETEIQKKIQDLKAELALSLDGLLILVVDDEEDTRQLLVQSLTSYGATVISAASAGEGLSELEDKKPDVLVSDIGMPDEDGYSLIRKVRALSDGKLTRIPAIALTAFTRAQDRMRALSSGYQSHVAKPVEPDELVTVIASLTGRLQINAAD